MSLAYAILGFVNEESMTGYDLKNKHFDVSVANFWSADQGQIYKTLDKLVEKDLLNFEIKYQDDKPNRKIYSITEKGKKDLAKWLEEDLDLNSIRDSFLIQIFFSKDLDLNKIKKLLFNRKEKHENNYKKYLEIKENFFNNIKDCKDKKHILQYLTLDSGIKYEKSWISWCEDSILLLESIF